MAVTDNQTKYSALSDDIKAYLAIKTLELAQKDLKFYPIGDKFKLSSGEGKTFRITKYERLNLPQSALTEGTPPSGTAMSITQVTAIADQWGDVVKITDVAELTISHPVMSIANDLLAKQAAETLEREIQIALNAATNIQYADKDTPTANNSRDDIVATDDIITRDEILKAKTDLKNKGARTSDGSAYLGVMNVNVAADIQNDSATNGWIDVSKYANLVAIQNAEIGKWQGVRWIESNFTQTYVGTAVVTSAADATASTLTAVSHDFVVVGRNKITGFDETVSQLGTITPTVSQSTKLTMPSDDDYTYDIYYGISAGALAKLTAFTDQVASDEVIVSAIGTGVAAPIAPASGVTVYKTYIFGKGAFGVTELTNIERFLTPNTPDSANPLMQFRMTGWKAFFKGVILNNDFMRVIESTSVF